MNNASTASPIGFGELSENFANFSKRFISTQASTSAPNSDLLASNFTEWNSTSVPTTTVSISAIKAEVEEQRETSMAIFFILFLIILSILIVHMLIKYGIRVVPESLAIVFLGAVIGFVLSFTKLDWTNEEAFSPSAFFLVLLPPIIFESGYNLNKGNFFTNFGSILVFAILGTAVSAFIFGTCIYLLGQLSIVYALDLTESYAFGSMISAVDPVATLAIFQALKVDPVLYMLVFGESVLNDAVAIVLYSAVTETKSSLGLLPKLTNGFLRFLLMFFGSAGIGVAIGLLSALTLKHIDLRKTPSLEFAILLVFAYLPYGFAEGIHLSGIMAILFCGIVMSHYTHYSLSPTTQITMQQTARTLSFIAETCVFAYLGLALFTFRLWWQPSFIIFSVLLCLVSRACNIFPLALILNRFRAHKITRKMQFIMWFSGLRGAVSFALALHMDSQSQKSRAIVVTTTLAIVLFTTVCLGGGTLPMMQLIERVMGSDEESNPTSPAKNGSVSRRSGSGSRIRNRNRRQKMLAKRDDEKLIMSKTQKLDHPTVGCMSEEENEQLLIDDVLEAGQIGDNCDSWGSRQNWLTRFDNHYLRPLLVRKFTKLEKLEDTGKVTQLLSQWSQDVQGDDSLSLNPFGESDAEENMLYNASEVHSLIQLNSNNNNANSLSPRHESTH